MTIRRVVRLADRGNRGVQAGLDALMAAIVLFVTMTFFTWFLALFPSLNDGAVLVNGLCNGDSACNYDWLEEMGGSSGAAYWLALALASVVFVLVSGGLSSSRRSPGMVVSGTFPVPARSVGTSDKSPPGRWRALARWAIVLALFMVGTGLGGNGLWGVALVTAAWLPAMVPGKRALYDVVTGTAIVESTLAEVEEQAPASGVSQAR